MDRELVGKLMLLLLGVKKEPVPSKEHLEWELTLLIDVLKKSGKLEEVKEILNVEI